MITELYIGNQKADFNDTINATFSCTDYRSMNSGSNNTSYTLDIPLTQNNMSLIKFASLLSIFDEQNIKSSIRVNDTEIIAGNLQIISIDRYKATVLISKDDWMIPLDSALLTDLDLSAYNHVYNSTNLIASWSAAAGNFYRYPMINFGKRVDASVSNWVLEDFVPWFNIGVILQAIFKGYAISSTFYNSAFFKSLYTMGQEKVADSSFVTGKGLDVKVNTALDNKVTGSITAPGASILTKNPIVMTNKILDEASAYNTGTYTWTCPTAGTYRFLFHWDQNCSYGGTLVTTTCLRICEIRKNGTAIASWTDTTSGIIAPWTHDLQTDYYDFQVGDTITVYIFSEADFSTGSGTATQNANVATELTVVAMNEQNNHAGRDAVINASQWLPPIPQSTFLKGLKDAFNLRFFLDQWNKTIYFEPADVGWIGTAIKDISSGADYTNIGSENISQNYSKTNYFQWLDDNADKSLQNYQLANKVMAYQKKITLSSLYTIPNVNYYINSCFCTFIKAYSFWNYQPLSTLLPKMWDDYDKTAYTMPQFRARAYGLKLGQWIGLSSGNFTYEGTAKTQYPQIDPLDMAALYASYFKNSFHLVDQGKLITIGGKVSPNDLTQFSTVVSNASNEGLRCQYKFNYQGEYHLGILNKYTTDGGKCIYELLILK